MILVQAALVTLLIGCAGYRPLAVGPGYLGIGAYKDYHKGKEEPIPHVDLTGVGILILKDRVTLGYSKTSILYQSKHLKNARIRLSQAELAFGTEADLMAREMTDELFKKKGGVR